MTTRTAPKMLPKTFVLLALLAAPVGSWANTRCEMGICRFVQTAPIPQMAKDTSQMPTKSAIKRRVTDGKFLLANGLSIGASVAATLTITRCRRDHGIGPCLDGGYGDYKAREGVRQAQTGILFGVSWAIKRIEDEDGSRHKFWWIFPIGNAVYNTAIVTVNATRHYGPRED